MEYLWACSSEINIPICWSGSGSEVATEFIRTAAGYSWGAEKHETGRAYIWVVAIPSRKVNGERRYI